jgi:hypothetical protein
MLMKPNLIRFRYSLTENKKALNKFLLAVNWDEEGEVGSGGNFN